MSDNISKANTSEAIDQDVVQPRSTISNQQTACAELLEPKKRLNELFDLTNSETLSHRIALFEVHVKGFKEEIIQTIASIKENKKNILKDSGVDLKSVQLLLKQHSGVEKQSTVVIVESTLLERKGKSLMDKYECLKEQSNRLNTLTTTGVSEPNANKLQLLAEGIQNADSDLQTESDSLLELQRLRRVKLQEAAKMFQLDKDVDKTSDWIKAMSGLLAFEELGSDVPTAKALLSVHKRHRTHIESFVASIEEFNKTDSQLLPTTHNMLPSIRAKLTKINAEVNAMKTVWFKRQQLLDHNYKNLVYDNECAETQALMDAHRKNAKTLLADKEKSIDEKTHYLEESAAQYKVKFEALMAFQMKHIEQKDYDSYVEHIKSKKQKTN